MDTTRIARVAYEARRAFYATQAMPQPEWFALDSWQRTAFLNQVRTTIINPGFTAEDLHELFLRERGDAGWSFGRQLDPKRKTDPYLKPWGSLTREQRVAEDVVVAMVGVFRIWSIPA